MKFREPHQLGADDPNTRKHRLVTLLGAWRVPRFEYWARPATPPSNTELAGDDLRLWIEILRVAESVPPRTHRAGLDIYARLLGRSVEDLEGENAVRIIGDRVALSGKVTGLPLRLYDWSLLVPERIGEQLTEAVLRRRFQDVLPFGERWLVSGSWFNCTDSICVLVQEALTATPEALLRLWQVSLGLHLEDRFLPALPAQPAERLAAKLGEELLAAADRLDVETDADLLRFAMGRTDGPRIMPMYLPASRFARLLEIERFFEHTRYRPGGSYYDAVASALARIAGNGFNVGDLLLKLKPGSALLSALESIALDRPELLAWYVFHQSLHAEGAFLLQQLMQRAALPQANHIDLNEEWLEVQRLGRELMLLNSQALDWDSLIALGVHDESQAVNRRHYGVAAIDREKAPYDGEPLWKAAVSDPARGQHFVEALERHFRVPGLHSDASFVFALKLLAPLRDSGQRALATRLATAIAEAYVAGLALGIASHSPTLLPAYGELLADLRDVLDRHGKAWRRFLRPFDIDDYLKRALDDQGERTTSNHSPAFTAPQLLRAHAETLAAFAAAMGDGFEEPLNAALELYKADREAQLHVPAFSWNALARITFFGARPVGEPLFLAMGRLFGRVTGEPRWLEEFLAEEKEAHILGWVLAGLGADHPLSQKFRPNLLALLDALVVPDHGIALGHAIELANILQQAGIADQSERFARYALQIIEGLNRGAQDQFSRIAQALLAVALAQQQKWQELLGFEPDRNAIVLSPHARVVENMRAVALLNRGRPQEAEDALKRVLNVEPGNAMALANLAAIPLHAQDWPGTIEAARRAKETVSGELRDGVILYEAYALEQLKDTPKALTVLGELSDEVAEREDVRAARRRLQGGGVTIVSVAPAAVASGALDALDDSVDIAIVTALPEEYDAVCGLLKDLRFAPTGQGREANFHGWQLGEIATRDDSARHTVVLATTERAGNLESSNVITRTIERWNPSVLLFCGVAGGIKRDGLTQGDVVLSEAIWYYPYGKIVDGTYKPDHRDYTPHSGLLTQGHIFGRTNKSWIDCGVAPPAPNHVPKCLKGLIGSGDMVIEELEVPFAEAILKARPKLQAVEMEAAGAGYAVQKAHELGRPVHFMMVRGISDLPKDRPGAKGAGTKERDDWKPYASAIAAKFIVSWVGSDAWPFLPRAVAADPQQDANVTRKLPPKR